MKIKLNLTSKPYDLEYLDTTPFIQGTDSRNKIEVLINESITLTNVQISYFLPNGRTTIAMANTSITSETIGTTTYNKVLFTIPQNITSVSGNLQATIIVTFSGNVYKFNINNVVLNSSDFDTYESALQGTAAQVLSALEAVEEAQTDYGTRISNCESTDTAQTNGISQLNTYVFGDSTGVDINDHDGLVYRVAQLESSCASEESKIEQLQTTVYGSTSGQTSSGLVSKVSAIETEIGNNSTNGSIKGRITKNETDIANINTEIGTNSASGTIKGRITAIEDADYQGQIDAINAGQNLADIVANLDVLNNLIVVGQTTNLKVNDKVQVLSDRSQDNASTVYNLSTLVVNSTTHYVESFSWSYIGRYGQDSYTKSETDALLNQKADKSTTYTKSETDALLNQKANANNVYTKAETYTKQEVNDAINDLGTIGYEMPYDRMLAIFNDAYANDPVVLALNNLNGEVV